MPHLKSFEEQKEFLDGLYEPSVVKQNLKESNGGYIWSVLELVKDDVAYKDISMLYDYYMENGSELIVKAITEYAYAHKLHDALAVFPLTEDDVTGLVDQAVSNIMFYDRKGDEEINIERIEAHFSNNPDAIDVMVAKFRQSLEESVNGLSKPEDLDDES